MDALKGGQLKSALELLHRIEDGGMSEEEVEVYQQKQVHKLLCHAMATVPRCRSMHSKCLQDWPVTNKESYRCNYDASISSLFKKEDLIKMSTSGSTGTPFTCYQDSGKKRHVNAEVLYYNGKTGYNIGRRIIYLRSIVTEVAKSNLTQFAENIYLLDCKDLSDQGIESMLSFIRQHTQCDGAMLMGYSSSLDAFRRYFEKHGGESASGCKIYGVIAGSEMLQDATRNSLESAFGCKCFSRYSNEENGFLGQDGDENNVFLMNRANYVVEILKMDRDDPVEDGEIGRVVVTDLYNYAMPMIRYDTGDVGAWRHIEINGRKRTAIGSFGGRKVDMITDTKGSFISPHSITNLMWQFQEIRQFQLIQTGCRSYVLKINVNEPFAGNQQLRDSYLRVLGEDADFSIVYTDEIPVLSSGKRRYIVNEINRNN